MRLFILILCVLFCPPSFAQSVGILPNVQKMMPEKLLDLSTMEVSPHELALTQVLSEICPPFLNPPQKRKFYDSYQKQLKALIPEFDPALVMRQINQQQDYRLTLQGVRHWTLSYPKEENRALCIEFAETPIF